MITLLYDIAGMSFALVVSALGVSSVLILNTNVPVAADAIAELNQLAQTPQGVLMIAGICVLIVVADLLVFNHRRAR